MESKEPERFTGEETGCLFVMRTFLCAKNMYILHFMMAKKWVWMMRNGAGKGRGIVELRN